MKQNTNYIAAEVADSCILVPVGKAAVDFNSIVSLNEMGKVIWEMLAEDKTAEELLQEILGEYEVTEVQAKADIESFLGKLRECGCIEE